MFWGPSAGLRVRSDRKRRPAMGRVQVPEEFEVSAIESSLA
jgi:hypothetical protein